MADFRAIPSIDELRQRAAIRALEARFGASATVDALRAAAAQVREAIARRDSSLASDAAVVARLERAAEAALDAAFRPSLQPVVNATGVILHTNLGRAPLAATAIERIAEVARGYSNLEYDVERGARGRRDIHAEELLRRVTGAAAGVVVNNNAAATLLILSALAAGREVVVSRGELVEIGGGFRVPDVMAQSGAMLREVGTTNKTRGADYAAAISDRTALILRVHPSNFRIDGFTERPEVRDLVEIARRFQIPLVEDLGSGYLGSDRGQTGVGPGSDPLKEEPVVAASLAAGVDVCCFSGDKLVGGPQAGIIVGRADLLERIRRHPLMRALRVDKLTYAALEATLTEYAAGRADISVPIRHMLAMSVDEIRARATALVGAMNALEGWQATVIAGTSAVGGGSAPGVELPTCLVSLERRGLTADRLEARLRAAAPPVIARIESDRVVLDLRTVLPCDDEQLRALLEKL